MARPSARPLTGRMRTQVAIIGAGRIRAGILEQSSVDLLRSVGLAERLDREADPHRGIYLQWPGERHHLDFVDLVGRQVFVYGQTEVQKDLDTAAHARGQ